MTILKQGTRCILLALAAGLSTHCGTKPNEMRSRRSVAAAIDVAEITQSTGTVNSKNGAVGSSDAVVALFPAFRAVIESKCVSCHSASGTAPQSDFAVLATADDWLRSRFVARGTPETSLIYYRLTNSEGEGGPKNMPTGAPLSAQELADVRAWVASTLLDKPSDEVCEDDRLPTARLWLLSDAAYQNTIEDIYGSAYANDLPPVNGLGKFGFLNQAETATLSGVQLTRLVTASEALSGALIASHNETKACLTAVDDRACAEAYARKFAPRMWRRPVTDAEIGSLMATYDALKIDGGNSTDALRLVIERLFLAPQFWYRSEFGDDGKVGADGLVKLKGEETASLLSYTIWNGPPDQVLMELATTGQLEDEAKLMAQVTRMQNDPRAKRGLQAFFDEWLVLKKILSIEKSPELYGSVLTEELRRDLRKETTTYLAESIFNAGADLTTLFTSQDTYVNDRVAGFYGISSTGGDDFRKVSTNVGQRAGLLTQASFIASHSGSIGTQLVHRADFFLNQIMCTPMGSPPANVPPLDDAPVGVDLSKLTTRERFTLLHSNKPACAGCHVKLDPVGAAFENYDAIGRYRTNEGTLPIDASGSLPGVADKPIVFGNMVELINAAVRTTAFSQCFAEKIEQYALGTTVTPAASCSVRKSHARMAKSAFKLRSVWEAWADPKVLTRRRVGSSRVDLQACKLEYSIVSPK